MLGWGVRFLRRRVAGAVVFVCALLLMAAGARASVSGPVARRSGSRVAVRGRVGVKASVVWLGGLVVANGVERRSRAPLALEMEVRGRRWVRVDVGRASPRGAFELRWHPRHVLRRGRFRVVAVTGHRDVAFSRPVVVSFVRRVAVRERLRP